MCLVAKMKRTQVIGSHAYGGLDRLSALLRRCVRIVPILSYSLALFHPFTLASAVEPSVDAFPQPAWGRIAQPTNSAPIAQDRSGAVTLQARDATTHSVMMRYEPATN